MWATVEDVYAYWPSLANFSEISDENIRRHIEEAEKIVQTDVQSQGFEYPFTGAETILRRLVVLKTLSSLLLYPVGEGGTTSRYSRIADDLERKYQAELRWATRTLGAISNTKRTPWGPITA